jgi:anti-sigma B factor antagonist
MLLNISTEQKIESATRVALSGSLDSDTAPDLGRELDPILNRQPKALIFDMADLDFISSAGLRVVLKTKKSVERYGGELAMVHLKPQVAKVFEIVEALPSMSIFANVEEMDEYLQVIQSRTAGKEG